MAEGCRYDGAPAWDGGAHCSGKFFPGTEALGEYLKDRFGGSYGGYACRPNTANESEQSVHGTGRAIDYFPNSKTIGDQVAELLVQHHEEWGIQLVIWYRHDWECDQGWNDYGGPVPHTDHLHIELTIPAATNNTAETYKGSVFMPGEVAKINGVTVRQGRMTREAVVAQGKLTRDFVAGLFEKAAEENRQLTTQEIRAMRAKVEHESDTILAALDAVDPDVDTEPASN